MNDWMRITELEAERDELRALAADLLDPDPCQYDHHNLCQAHHLHERPCPHERAKALGIEAA